MFCGNGVNFFKVCLIVFYRILSVFPRIFVEDKYMVALALVVIIMKGCTFHLLFIRLWISGWYFLIFVVIVANENL